MPHHASPPLLVVEDDPNDMFLFTRLLNAAGTRQALHLALDQAEAIRLLTPVIEESRVVARPAAVFASLSLPRGGGLELLRWIRAQPALDNVPVLLMGRHAKRTELERAAKLGAQCVFNKFPGKIAFARMLDDVTRGDGGPNSAAFKLRENLL